MGWAVKRIPDSLAHSKVNIKPDWRIGSIKGCSHESID